VERNRKAGQTPPRVVAPTEEEEADAIHDILVGSVHTTRKNTEVIVIASKESGLDVTADKTKCMVISGDQNAGRGHSIKTGNSAFERASELKYLRTTQNK
jgi:hypothetical protein